MWGILSLVTESLGGKKIYIAFIVALIAAAGYGYYQKERADGLEANIALYKEQLQSAKTIDEMNKQTARANEAQLSAALEKQNQMFDKLAALQNEQSQKVLDRLNQSQAATSTQYNKVAQAIGKIQIQSCEGMVDELISFPEKLGSVGSTK